MKSKKVVNIAASFRARLLHLARERNEDFQYVLSRWVIERFLYRLSISPHKDSFVLKGAMLFAAWTGKVYRPTRDLDLLGYGSPDIDHLVTAFREVSTIDGADGLLFEPGRIEGERIKESAEYEGVTVSGGYTLMCGAPAAAAPGTFSSVGGGSTGGRGLVL